MQVGENDSVAPPAAAQPRGSAAGSVAEVRTYPVDHFDVYDGAGQRQALADQLDFLDPPPGPATTPPALLRKADRPMTTTTSATRSHS